jgi:hypothetical protein
MNNKIVLSKKRGFWINFLLVFLAALLVRLIFIAIFISSHPEVYNNDKWGSAELGWVAVNFYEGRGFSSPFQAGDTPTAFFAPLVPLIWSLVFHITNGATGKSEAVIIIIQAAIGAFLVSTIWACAYHVERKDSSRLKGFAFWVGFLFILWPESILRTINSWYFIWQDVGLALLVYCGMLWFDKPAFKYAACMGFIAGFIANVNPVPVPIYLVILIYPLWNQRVRSWAIMRNILISLVIAGTCVAPWIIRNYLIFDQIIPMRSNFGLELWQGNNPKGGIRQNWLSPHPIINAEELNSYKEMGEVGYFRSDLMKALNFIRTNPAITMKRVIGRIYVTWFTDIFDTWSWFPGNKWWNSGIYSISLSLCMIFTAILSLAVVIYGLLTKKLSGLPYTPIYISIFLFIPLSYYFTLASPDYVESLRSWLAFLAVYVLRIVWGESSFINFICRPQPLESNQ